MNEPQPSPDPAATAEAPANGDLAARLEQAERQRDEYLILAKQTQADFENYQKRAARDREQERPYLQRPLALELLPVLDNLERALDAARQAGDNGPLVQGVAATLAQLQDALKRHSISRVAAEGSVFDPNLHQAVMQQPSADQEPGTVVKVLQHGYQIHDRVLRPASVVVATRPEGGA